MKLLGYPETAELPTRGTEGSCLPEVEGLVDGSDQTNVGPRHVQKFLVKRVLVEK